MGESSPPRSGTEDVDPARPERDGAPRRRIAVLGFAVALVLLVVVVVALMTRAEDAPSPGPGADAPTATGTADPSPRDEDGPGEADGTEDPADPSGTDAPDEGAEGGVEPTDPPAEPTLPAGPDLLEEIEALVGDLPTAVGTVDEEVRVADLLATVVDVRAVEAETRGVGQIAGEALVVTVEIRNEGGAPASLATVDVNAYQAGTPVPTTVLDSDPNHAPLAGTVPAGGTVSGDYVFSRPGPEGLTIVVLLGPEAGAVVIEGVRAD